MKDNFDYIIVGAGSAGSVLANRLSADGKHSVLIIEAGGKDRSLWMSMPLGAGRMFYDPTYNWPLETEPEAYCDNRVIGLCAGKVLGGSSSINGMMYTRGHPRDYDQWAQSGCAGWSYDDVLPYFRKAETNWRGSNDVHGDDGPLTTSRAPKDGLHDILAKTATNLGHVVTDDFSKDGPNGFGLTDITTHNGRRGSTSRRYLQPALQRKNLMLISNAETTRVLIEGQRATGIEFVRNGQKQRIRAHKEVILSAGAYHSPKLLMLSGIGPSDHLSDVGITCINDLPGVGANLQDHYGYSIVYKTHEPMDFDKELRLDRLARSAVRWGVAGDGPISALPLSGIAFCRTREGIERPDVELLFTPAALDAQVWFPGWRPPNGQMLAISVSLMRPESIGHVRLRSSDPFAAPRITVNYLAQPEDRATLLRAAHLVRSFMASQPVASVVANELYPGISPDDDEAVEGYIRSTVRSMMHGCGSCAMGTNKEAVVDPELRVRGIKGLRVVDASVMPAITTGHTNAPTIMIAEKAADLILKDRDLVD
jgi:choline dehydrogenase